MNTTALVFQDTAFDIVDQSGRPWLKGLQIAAALGYSDPSAINRIYARRSDEFTDEMTATVKLTDPNGDAQETRIFSLRGAHLIAMFARTAIAKTFRQWVLDILDREAPSYEAKPYAVNPTDKLTKDEADTLRRMLREGVEKLPKDKQASFMIKGWSKLKAHFGVTYREIPRAEFAEAVSLVARHVAEGEYIAAAPAPALPPPDPITRNLRARIHKQAHALSLAQYDTLQDLLEELVTSNMKCGATEADCEDYLNRFGSHMGGVTLVNTHDLYQLSRTTTNLLDRAGEALAVIHRLEKHTGLALYQRESVAGLPDSLCKTVFEALKDC